MWITILAITIRSRTRTHKRGRVRESVMIWILGASGMLGSSLSQYLDRQRYSLLLYKSGHNNRQLPLNQPSSSVDLVDRTAVFQEFHKAVSQYGYPQTIVNLVALTDVEACEQNPQLAYQLNTLTVENLVAWIKQQDFQMHLIHLSTDQVYDGQGSALESEVCIRNMYAFSKYAGELAAQGVLSTVLRTNFVGQSRCAQRQSFSDWLVASLQAQKALKAIKALSLFHDVWFGPLVLSTLCEAIELTLKKRIPGVYNLGSRDTLSKAEFAISFAQGLGLPLDTVTQCSVSEHAFRAYRPRNMGMNVSLFETTFGTVLPTMSEVMSLLLSQYKHCS